MSTTRGQGACASRGAGMKHEGGRALLLHQILHCSTESLMPCKFPLGNTHDNPFRPNSVFVRVLIAFSRAPCRNMDQPDHTSPQGHESNGSFFTCAPVHCSTWSTTDLTYPHSFKQHFPAASVWIVVKFKRTLESSQAWLRSTCHDCPVGRRWCCAVHYIRRGG